MKLKDIHTNLNPEIDLQKFHPKREVSVDSFWVEENKKVDISLWLEETIQLAKDKSIKLKSLNKKRNIDVLKNNTCKNIDLNNDKKIEQGKKSTNKQNIFSFLWKSYSWKIQRVSIIFWQTVAKLWIKNKKFDNKNNLWSLLKKILFIIIFIFIIFLNKSAVEYFTKSWYEKLVKLQSNDILENREEILKSSNLDFKISNILFTPFKILPLDEIDNINNSILWWIWLTNLFLDANNFIDWILLLNREKWYENIMYSQFLLNNKDFFIKFENDLVNILDNYNSIKFDNDLIQSKVELLKLKLNELNFYTQTFNNNFETFLNILWHNKRKKYLIAFQNNDEIRPMWWFMWSLWIVELFRWQVKKFEKKDVYNYEFKIKKENFVKEPAPKWINKLTTYLWLRDSNYFINHKDSGNKIKFFMDKAWYKIDWILYVNQNSLFSILDLVWEFDSKVLNTKINSSNFSLIMSLLVEAKVSQKTTMWTPKKILFDFMEELKEIIKERNISDIEIMKPLLKDIQNRELVFYNFNEKERILLEQFSIFNKINYWESLDFSYPVFTSISWNKSDRYIKTSFTKKITSWKWCSYITELKVNLEHTFTKKEESKIKNLISKYNIEKDIEKLLYIQWLWENKQFVRVIIPKDAILYNNNVWVNYYKERWKSVDFFLNTGIWKKSEFILKYKLENKECNTYDYKHYKQPWLRKYDLNIDKLWQDKKFEQVKTDIYYY